MLSAVLIGMYSISVTNLFILLITSINELDVKIKVHVNMNVATNFPQM